MNTGEVPEQDLSRTAISARHLAVSLAIVLIVGAAVTYQVARSTDEDIRSMLLVHARTAACLADMDNLRSLVNSEEGQNSTYFRLLHDQQSLVVKANPLCRWTYFMTMRQDRVVFLLDSEPQESKDRVSFGMVYGEAPNQFRDAFIEGREMTLGPYTDRWGIWVTALIPLVDRNSGDVLSVFGMDIDAQTWNKLILQRCAAPAAVTMLIASLFVAFFIIYRRSDESNRRIAATGERLKHAMERVNKSQANFSMFFNSAPDLLFVMDSECKILKINSTVTSRLGYSESDLIGRPLMTVFPPEFRDESGQAIWEMLDDSEMPYLAPLQARDGRTIMVETRVTRGEWDEKPALFGISKDISALRLSEEKFSKAFNSSSTLMVISSVEDGRILDVNDAFSKILGFSSQEAAGRSMVDLHIIDLPSMEAVLKETAKDGEPNNKNIEALARAKDGTIRQGLFSSQEIVIDERPCRLIVMTDITEIKRAQEALRAEEARTKALFRLSQMSDRSADEISDRALEYGAALTLSRAGCLVFLNEDGTAKSQRGWPDNGADVGQSAWNEAARSRKPVVANDILKHMAVPLLDGDRMVAVAVMVDKDGDYTENDVIGLTILMDGMLHMVRKVQADDARRKSEARLANIIDFLPDATFAVDGERRIVAWNRVMVEMTGCTKEMMLGKAEFAYAVPFYGRPRPIGVDLTFDELSDIEKRYDYVKRKEGQIIAEVRIPALFGGKGAYLWIIAAPLYDDQGIMIGAIESIRDITERKDAEDLLKSSLEERKLLLKEAHHRVKNNLQIISSLLKLQAGRVQDGQTISALTESQNRISSLALVHEKLYQSENLARINFGAYAEDLAGRLVGSFGKEGVDLRLDLEDVSLDIDKAIPCGLIINELITNCMKHAFPGDRNGEIAISLKRVEGKIALVVKDDGPGLPEGLDILKSRTLGMTLIAALTRQLKGKIEAENDGGAEFQLTFEA